MTDEVREFFDRHAETYHSRPGGLSAYHAKTARIIESGLSGAVLSIGGIWAQARSDPARFAVTVADLSRTMLAHDRPFSARGVACNAAQLAFRTASFDHVVLPLLLHHVTGRSAGEARRGVRSVLREAARVLKPGGRIWISELCAPTLVYWAELVAAPLTRRLLGLIRTPLVVMHSTRFYVAALREEDWRDIRVQPIEPDEKRRLGWVTPIIGFPHLRVPLALYPIRPTLISARRPGE